MAHENDQANNIHSAMRSKVDVNPKPEPHSVYVTQTPATRSILKYRSISRNFPLLLPHSQIEPPLHTFQNISRYNPSSLLSHLLALLVVVFLYMYELYVSLKTEINLQNN